MQELGINFEVIPSYFDESSINEADPRRLVVRLAEEKTRLVAKAEKGIIIGADAVFFFNGQVLGKPKTVETARHYLEMMSGKTANILTGMCVMNTENGYFKSLLAETVMHVKQLSSAEITEYLATDEDCLECAGALSVNGVKLFSEKLEGDVDAAFAGLSNTELVSMLRENEVTI